MARFEDTTLANLSCDCLTFHTYAHTAPCTIAHSQSLSWCAAQSFASEHNLGIIFASQRTAARVVEAKQPLPTSVLMSASLRRTGHETGRKVVCGNGNEVQRNFLGGGSEAGGNGSKRETTGFAGETLGILVLFLVLYAVVDYLRSRSWAKHGHIELEGLEMRLGACAEGGSPAYPEPDEKNAYEVPVMLV